MGYFKSFQKSFKKVTSVELSRPLLILIVAVLLYIFRNKVRGFIKNTTGVEMFSQESGANAQWHADLTTLSQYPATTWGTGAVNYGTHVVTPMTDSNNSVLNTPGLGDHYDMHNTGEEFFLYINYDDSYTLGLMLWPIPVKIFETGPESEMEADRVQARRDGREAEYVRELFISEAVRYNCAWQDPDQRDDGEEHAEAKVLAAWLNNLVAMIMAMPTMQSISTEIPDLDDGCHQAHHHKHKHKGFKKHTGSVLIQK